MWLLVVLAFGGIVGWLASYLMQTGTQSNILVSVVVGVVGAAIGNWLGGALGLGEFGTVGRFLVAMVGAVILLAGLRALKVYR